MFDIGFWEMAFIGIIALVVIGPERLPGVAHRVGIWVGKSRRMLNEVMSDVRKEMKEYDVEQVKTLGGELKSASNQLKDITQSTSDALRLKEVGSAFKQSVMSDIETNTSDSPRNSSVQKTSKAVSKKGKTTTAKTIKKTTPRKPTTKTAIKKPAIRKKTTTKTTTKTSKKTASKRPAKKVASAKSKR